MKIYKSHPTGKWQTEAKTGILVNATQCRNKEVASPGAPVAFRLL